MNQKTLITLGIVTVVTVIAAFALDRSRAPRSDVAAASQTLVADLRERVNDVGKITLTKANNQVAVTLERGDGGWKVAQRGGYPADVGKLREFVLKIADASLLEQKTSNRDRHADLGVEDVSAPSAKGVLVDIEGLGQPARFIVGTFNGQGGGGTFVRRTDEAQSWLARGTLTPDTNPADWLAKDLANVSADRIESVTLTRPDGKNVRAVRKAPGDARFDVTGVPKGRELASEFVANGLGAVLSELKIDDVVPASESTPPAQVIKARYVAVDGLAVEAEAWKVDEKGHARFIASLDTAMAERHVTGQQAKAAAEAATAAEAGSGEPAPVTPAASEARATAAPAAAVDPAKDRESRLTALTAEVAALNKAFEGWVFVLPSHKYANIDKSMDDLLKPVEAK